MNSAELEVIYGRYYENGHMIRTDDLAARGYRFTARFINIGRKYKLFELLPSRSDEPPNICFLTDQSRQRGVILQDPFREHKAKLSTVNSIKDKVLNAQALFKQKITPPPEEGNGKEPGSALPEQEGKPAALDRGKVGGSGLQAQG